MVQAWQVLVSHFYSNIQSCTHAFCSQQAFRGIEKKYKGTVISQGDNATATPTAKRKTPAKSAKRGSEAIEDDEDTPSGKKAKVEHDGDETPSKPEKTTKKVDAPIKHERD